jgi:thiosulfate/3-mercaptopyruvate sulfurtransferase
MNMPWTTLVRADALRAALAAGAAPLLIDCGFDLTDPDAGERAWRDGHLPGAHYLHLDRDLSGTKSGRNGRHPLPAREAWAARVGQLDLVPGRQVVVTDRQGGMFAARAWWMLRWLGHAEVAVLDGGVDAWTRAGGPLDTAPATAAAGAPYPARASLVATIDADNLQRALGRVPLLDARAGERFRGEVEPLDAQAGHIPGALNRFFKDNLAADGTFKPGVQLHAEFRALLGGTPAAEAVHQCGSGVTACHNLLAMEHAGLTGSRLYAGSWSEWSADPQRPVARS